MCSIFDKRRYEKSRSSDQTEPVCSHILKCITGIEKDIVITMTPFSPDVTIMVTAELELCLFLISALDLCNPSIFYFF